VTNQRPDQDVQPACRGCRGRGWKHISSRTPLALGIANDSARATTRRRCLDCDGSGKE
jgi:hypothetical protein